jgi:AcrR family transcriptional regulator
MARRANNIGPRAQSSKRRQHILSIAAEVFAQEGYTNATVRAIATEAGILSGSLYQHFESKDAMLAEILGSLLDRILDSYRAVVATTVNPVEQFHDMVVNGYRLVAENHVGITILHNDYAYISGIPAFSFVRDFNKELEDVWLDVLQRGIEEGFLRPDLDVYLTYREVMGALLAAVRWLDPKGRVSPEQVAEHQVRLYTQGMLAHAPDGRSPVGGKAVNGGRSRAATAP